ncbi:substrate-binding periplasmic protein [Parvularcula dongshanensis]|uniref:Polar amino acid transport system substrate-binding protein n=1 Tax=Parvularcula dongshanensis TaxID=1173995 RepID=A0A840HZM4_9PROT|nr:transporter substrate-binding domain-containing protein [Parvularcula dongshanensis]MBB4657555.1 polar amino acid transport system substrate-binding protein [Parvularcula dongshanensis]
MSTGRRAASILIGLLGFFGARSVAQEALPIYTDTWRPFVSGEGEEPGAATRVMRLVATEMGALPEFRRFDFGYAYVLVRDGRAPLAFPYIKTDERAGEVVFSKAPILSMRNRVYVNRRFRAADGVPAGAEAGEVLFGRVAGYSYGPTIDALIERQDAPARVFGSDRDALAQLLAGEVDAVPMAESVAQAILPREFAAWEKLVHAASGIEDETPLHVIAPRTPEGEALMARFDAAYARLVEEELLVSGETLPAPLPDRARDRGRIIAAEGNPIALGRSWLGGDAVHECVETAAQAEESGDRFALPPGTSFMVLAWSCGAANASPTARLYKTMTDESRVLILDGPSSGRELLVKNMHIAVGP